MRIVRRRMALATAATVLLYVVFRALGAAEHTAVLAGMPRSDLSILIGPIYVLLTLGTFVAAPIVFLAIALDLAAERLQIDSK